MKKIAVFALLFFVGSSFLYAQKGVGFGLNFAYHSIWTLNQSAYGDAELDEVTTFHPAFGVQGFYNLTDFFGVNVEFNKVMLGQKYEDVAKSITREIKLNYWAVPILAKLAFGGDKAKFHFMIGPELAFLTKASQTYKLGTANFPGSTKDLDGKSFVKAAEDVKDRYEKMDVMLAFDLGADIKITDIILLNAGLRANYGFKDINATAYRIKNVKGDYTASQNAYFGLQLGVSYFIGRD